MHRLLAALMAATACANIAQAQTAPPADAGQTQSSGTPLALAGPVFSVDHALDLAGVVSPALEAASADVRAAEAGRQVAGLRPNPTVTVEAENVAGSGQYRGTQSLEATTSLTLPLELGGKRSALSLIHISSSTRIASAAPIRAKL